MVAVPRSITFSLLSSQLCLYHYYYYHYYYYYDDDDDDDVLVKFPCFSAIVVGSKQWTLGV